MKFPEYNDSKDSAPKNGGQWLLEMGETFKRVESIQRTILCCGLQLPEIERERQLVKCRFNYLKHINWA